MRVLLDVHPEESSDGLGEGKLLLLHEALDGRAEGLHLLLQVEHYVEKLSDGVLSLQPDWEALVLSRSLR